MIFNIQIESILTLDLHCSVSSGLGGSITGLSTQDDITRTAKTYDSDKYYKKFKTCDHLVTMLYATTSCVSSLRELATVLLACQGRISHLNLKHFPKRSTLSDANKKRTSKVFVAIYGKLYKRYAPFLSDSSSLNPPVKDLQIVDSTTISLFSDILKGVVILSMVKRKEALRCIL